MIHNQVLVASDDRKLLENSVSYAEEDTVMDEVEDLEKALLKRRTELRKVEHLLSEAEADLKDARAKVFHNYTALHFSRRNIKIASIIFLHDCLSMYMQTKDTLQRYSEAERQLKETECELEGIKQRTQDSIRQLVQTKQQLWYYSYHVAFTLHNRILWLSLILLGFRQLFPTLCHRDLQEEVKDLQRSKQHQENTLEQMEKVIAAQDEEFQQANRNLKRVTNK